MGLTRRTSEAHCPAPALGAPKIASGRFSLRKAAAISAASSLSSSPAASTISYRGNSIKEQSGSDGGIPQRSHHLPAEAFKGTKWIKGHCLRFREWIKVLMESFSSTKHNWFIIWFYLGHIRSRQSVVQWNVLLFSDYWTLTFWHMCTVYQSLNNLSIVQTMNQQLSFNQLRQLGPSSQKCVFVVFLLFTTLNLRFVGKSFLWESVTDILL